VEDIGKGDNLYSTFSIGPEFLDQFGIKTVAGQKFALDRPAVLSDTGKSRGPIPVMINEAAASALGFADAKSAVGQILVDRNGMGMTFEYEIIGVSQNFHQKSLKEAYLPIVFRLEDGSSIEYYAIKFKTQDVQKTVARIQDTYRGLFPASPFEYFFLDEFFNNQYKQDVKFGKIFGIFSSLAIFIGCLGLLGLSMFTNMQRTKEIGIRKVLGASNGSILALLFKDFAKLILISSLIAWPLSYLGVYYWLQGYAFRINIHILLFIIPTLIVLLVAFITVGWRTWKVGSVTPVRALRSE
jgi:putative ABC transport system permease protein